MNKQKRALITGIGGQDGSYLSEFLLNKGYLVRGITRRTSLENTQRIRELDLEDKHERKRTSTSPFCLYYGDLTDASSIRSIIEEVKPDEIYNLGAQSHVGISYKCGRSTIEINTFGALGILDTLKDMKLDCKFYQASSSEMFGISPPPQNEDTPMLPQSPYGIAKLAAFHATKMYRNAYGMFAANGILFNHESPRRGYNFVTKKITTGLAKILTKEEDRLILGNLDTKRDWGYSKEYVEAMWKILQHDKPDDFVISTEETHTIRDFVKEAFKLVGLDYEDFVEISEHYKRPLEVPALLGDSSKAKKILGWEAKTKFKDLISMMLVSDLKERFEQTGIIPMKITTLPDSFYIEKGRELAKNLKK